jgi:CubicO group peptidase (beta-lactamase class C family)
MTMSRLLCLMVCMTISVFASDPPKLPAVTTAIQSAIDAKEVPGAVTAVVTKDRLIDLQAVGFADVESAKPMMPDSIFRIKSMTKPVTAVAVLMLQDEGKLNVEDKVAKYLPGFGDLKTPSGKAADLTIGQLLDHTSGLGEATKGGPPARTLADLLPRVLASPMQFEPGERWKYTQSGINMAAHIVEVVSGQPFDVFLEQRLFRPLGMKDTTFYPSGSQLDRVVMRYKKSKESGALEPEPARTDLPDRTRPPTGHDGLYSTAPDFARFAQMLLNDGQLDGRRYLKPESVKRLATPRTGGMKAGFVPGSAWGLGVGIVAQPQGVTAALSPGTYGHGGAYGTQLWVDPAKGIAYVLMIQRTTFGTPGYRNADDTKLRADFQQAAAP